MTRADSARGDRELAWLRRGALVAGCAFVAVFALTAVLRLRYRFELEWMEGAMLDVVLRVLDGRKLYVEPSIHYVPFIYPPLYFYVSAAACMALGRGFLALRLVSLLSALGCMAIIFRFVQRETRDVAAALAAAGLYAATFAAGGGWFDLARVDSLFLCLLLGALYVMRFAASARGQVGGGALLALAYATKQLALPIALPILAFAVCCNRRWFVAAALAAGGAETWALERLHAGWYAYYVFTLPSHHALATERAGELLYTDVVRVLPIAGGLGIALLCNAFGRTTLARDDARAFYACTTVGMLLGSMLARLHVGGAVNALHPAYAAIALIFGLALSSLWQARAPLPLESRTRAWVLCALLCAQFGLLAYDPRAYIPTRADADAGERMLARVRALPGDVLVPFHGFLSSAARKPAYAHQMAMMDLYRSGVGWQRWKTVDDALDQAIRERRFGAVLVDFQGWHAAALRATYRSEALAPSDAGAWPRAGMPTRPSLLYVKTR